MLTTQIGPSTATFTLLADASLIWFAGDNVDIAYVGLARFPGLVIFRGQTSDPEQ